MALIRPPRLARVLPLAALAPLIACGEPTAVALSERLGPPDIEGVLGSGPAPRPEQWLVTREKVDDECADRVLVTIDGGTDLRWSDGTRARRADLAVGLSVHVWFWPVMLRSCPGQTHADALVLH